MSNVFGLEPIVVDVIFAIINFAVLVALAVYGVIVYVVPGIRSSIQSHNARHDELIAQRTRLREACRHVEDQIAQQEEVYHRLYDTIATWSRIMRENEQKRTEAYRRRYETVRKRQRSQNVCRIERKLLQTYAPDAFAQARGMLQQQYDTVHGVAYIRSVVQQVEQRNE